MGKEDDLLRAAVEGDVAKTEKLLTKPHGSFFKRSTARVKVRVLHRDGVRAFQGVGVRATAEKCDPTRALSLTSLPL